MEWRKAARVLRADVGTRACGVESWRVIFASQPMPMGGTGKHRGNLRSRGALLGGVVHIPHYEKWGSGHMFKAPPYAMNQNQQQMKLTVTVDSRGAHILAAVNIFSPGSSYYQWRQTVQITNQDGVLVDIGNYLLPGGKLNPQASVGARDQ
jgi:hypothetical protein